MTEEEVRFSKARWALSTKLIEVFTERVKNLGPHFAVSDMVEACMIHGRYEDAMSIILLAAEDRRACEASVLAQMKMRKDAVTEDVTPEYLKENP